MAARRLEFIPPMLASADRAPDPDGEWLYEVKFDGYRALMVKNGPEVELWSRNHKSLNAKFPALVAALKKIKIDRCILDGEICALDGEGKSSFQLLQNTAVVESPLIYYLFDLLFVGDDDLTVEPLRARKERLDELYGKFSSKVKTVLSLSPMFSENPKKILEKMREAKLEGAIAKRPESRYLPGRRSPDWIKIKFEQSQEFVIVGYTLPKNSRQYFGALLLGYYHEKHLVFAGRVGTGFDEKMLKKVYGLLAKIEQPKSSVEDLSEPSTRWRMPGWKASETKWVKPTLVAQIKFTEWTNEGQLRHPSFLGLRDDKSAAHVVRE